MSCSRWRLAVLPIACFLVFAASAFAESGQPPPSSIARAFTGLSSKELDQLRSGEAVIRSAANPRNLALAVEGRDVREIRERFAALGPNYFAEFMFVMPTRPGYLTSLQALLANPKNLVGISYYSKKNRATYTLFDRVEVLRSEALAEGGARVLVRQHMEPFDDYRAAYKNRLAEGSLYFSFENEDPLVYSYQKFRAAGSGDLSWMLYAWESEGWTFFYGAGGVKAFDLFGVFRSRLEASFMGRIEAFFTFAMDSQKRKKP